MRKKYYIIWFNERMFKSTQKQTCKNCITCVLCHHFFETQNITKIFDKCELFEENYMKKISGKRLLKT